MDELWYTVEDLDLEFNDLPMKDVLDAQGDVIDQVIDDALVKNVLKDTQNFIISYLRKAGIIEYTEEIKYEVKDAYYNIAHYKYSVKEMGTTSENIKESYKEAVDYIREIAAGKALLSEKPTRVGLINRRIQRG